MGGGRPFKQNMQVDGRDPRASSAGDNSAGVGRGITNNNLVQRQRTESGTDVYEDGRTDQLTDHITHRRKGPTYARINPRLSV